MKAWLFTWSTEFRFLMSPCAVFLLAFLTFAGIARERVRQNWKTKSRNTQRLSKSQVTKLTGLIGLMVSSQVTELEACKIHLVNQLTQLRKLKSYPGWLKTTQTVNLFELWLSSLLIFVYWNSRRVFVFSFYFEIALFNTGKNKRFPLSQTTKEPVFKGSILIVFEVIYEMFHTFKPQPDFFRLLYAIA